MGHGVLLRSMRKAHITTDQNKKFKSTPSKNNEKFNEFNNLRELGGGTLGQQWLLGL
jgi:hypothetical protein